MRFGSELLRELGARDPVPAGVQALTVRTPFDDKIFPNESSVLPGVEDVIVCCPTHKGLLYDLEAFDVVQAFLLDGR